MTREEIVGAAREWIGTRFQPHGFNRHGCDCWGLILGLGLELGLDGWSRWASATQFHGYSFPPDPRQFARGCDFFLGDKIQSKDAQLADVLVLRFEHEPIHFSLISALSPTYVIHALSRLGRVVEHRLDANWSRNVVRAYRFRGVA